MSETIEATGGGSELRLKSPRVIVADGKLTVWFSFSTVGVTVDDTLENRKLILKFWQHAMYAFRDATFDTFRAMYNQEKK